VRGSVHGGMRLSGSARGSVRLSSGAATCGRPAVSVFSNKFKTYSYKSVQIRNKSDNLKQNHVISNYLIYSEFIRIETNSF
jgi:hypothetical protein